MKLLLISAALAMGLAEAEPAIDLSGEWKFVLDPKDLGLQAGPDTWNFPDTIELPGTTASRGKGQPLEIELNLKKPSMQHLHQKFPYIGPAWYQRTVTVPSDWEGEDIILTLERVLWESRVWVDKRPVGSPQNSVSTPHRYDLSSTLTPGKQHTITLRIDNRPQVDIGTIGHAYTQETQTVWNGVIGDLKLEAVPTTRIRHLGIRCLPDHSGLELDFEFFSKRIIEKADLHLGIRPNGEGEFKPVLKTHLRIAPGTPRQKLKVELPDDLAEWSEFNPSVHQLSVALIADGKRHRITLDFGLRTIGRTDRDILINDRKTFLRGNLECAIFPQTGHPDAEGPQWEKIMRTSREYGLNHLRFHSWCPPAAAFEAADRHGIYLQVELPNWTFDMGRKPKTDAFLKAEGERILREFGHHPSFVMFSLGNELKGDLKHMDGLIEHFRQLAPDLLYTSTSYAFSPRGLRAGPQDDFFITQQSASGWVRGQGFLNSTFPTTDSDYAEGLSSVAVPLVTHEVGQYVVYPNLAEIPKYEMTPLRPTALEAIRADLSSKELLDDAARFTRDSGKLAALLYKEDIERALRTKDLAGIQLLQLQDFPGQSTATVGLLDAFWDSKGVISPEEFRQFSASVVPLVRMEKFVWENTETLAAKFELANFSDGPLETGFTAKLVHGEVIVAEQRYEPRDYPLGNGLEIGRYEAPLAAFGAATRLDLVIESDAGHRNRWPLWIYPAEAPATEAGFVTHRGVTDECLTDLAAGKKVLLLPPSGAVKKSLPARFIPVFWSPLHFPNQPGTLGATIDTDHPMWKHFPTDTHTNWQWWELTAESTAVDLSTVRRTIEMPFRFIDKYNRNALPTAIFEASVGPGKLLVCTLDVESRPAERIVARQLRRALEHHIASSEFAPVGSLTAEQLQSLIGETSLVATASSAHSSTPASHAVDGNIETLWHTDWTKGNALPASLTLDMLKPKPVSGLRCTPRQDMPNGRVAAYEVAVSNDGSKWLPIDASGTLPDTKEVQEIRFKKPIKARYLRLSITRDHQRKGMASMAEIEPIMAEQADVRDLGIIPGFNDAGE